MRKAVPFLLPLVAVLLSCPAFADPLPITGGAFLDIEGDMFTFTGSNFSLTTTTIGNYAAKEFPGRCESSGLGFCPEAAGSLSNWGFHTTGGDQLLGTGIVRFGDVNAADVDLRGSMRFDVVPTRITPNEAGDFDFIAPFTFDAMIRGVQGTSELFAREFVGTGFVRVNYEATSGPGIFAAADETIEYQFAGAPSPVPEPGTLALLGSGLAAAALRRRSQR